MSRILPYNAKQWEVRAILYGRKTVTRRLIKPEPQRYFEVNEEPLYIYDTDFQQGRIMPPYQPGDILYVRETWERFDCCSCEGDEHGNCPKEPKKSVLDKSIGCYMYRSTDEISGDAKWHPSIHMPKEAARIFLKVKDVRVERLQECGKGWCLDIEKEGIVTPQNPILYINDDAFHDALREEFQKLWDSTINKSDIDRYGWDANPWVWVIEFERCEKPED